MTATPTTNRLAVLHSSASDDWWTPPAIIDAAIAVLGEIDLDPACNDGAPNVPAKKHYRKADDGLNNIWSGRVFLNPPYGRVLPKWTNHLIVSYETGQVTAAICLVPSRTDTAWFRQFAPYPRCYVSGRLKFSGSNNAAPFPSVIFYLGSNIDAFVREFRKFGHIYEGAIAT